MERKLATIAKILDIQPIPNADAIEVATIRGWKVVVKRGDFRAGDMCVYCEIDSLMPRRPEFEFLAPRGYRIKTVKLRGQVSQGIAFPLTILPEPTGMGEGTEGWDVTDLIGVIKYEPPIPAQLAGLVKGLFPGFIPKTDEERVQNIPWVLEKYCNVDFYATEKLNGTSITCYLKNGEFGVCSRNLELKETADNTIWQTVRKLKVEEEMRGATAEISAHWNYALQGELVGVGISGNQYQYKMNDRTIMFYNAYDIDNGEYFNLEEFSTMFEFMNLSMVPMVSRKFSLPCSMDTMLALADGRSYINPNVNREGIVVRSIVEHHEPDIPNGRLSFKVISNQHLLKEKE